MGFMRFMLAQVGGRRATFRLRKAWVRQALAMLVMARAGGPAGSVRASGPDGRTGFRL